MDLFILIKYIKVFEKIYMEIVLNILIYDYVN